MRTGSNAAALIDSESDRPTRKDGAVNQPKQEEDIRVERIEALEEKFSIELDEKTMYLWQERLRRIGDRDPNYPDVQIIYRELGGVGNATPERLEKAFLTVSMMGYSRKKV
jgi:hypothetical protein